MEKELDIPLAITKQELIRRVHELVNHDGLKYSEAVVEVCDEHNIDYEDIVPMINKGVLKQKLEVEAMHYNSIPNTIGGVLF